LVTFVSGARRLRVRSEAINIVVVVLHRETYGREPGSLARAIDLTEILMAIELNRGAVEGSGNISPTVVGKENGFAFKGIGGILVAVFVTIKPRRVSLVKVVPVRQNLVTILAHLVAILTHLVVFLGGSFVSPRNVALALRSVVFPCRKVLGRLQRGIKRLVCEPQIA
jgi:hypothetical protein